MWPIIRDVVVLPFVPVTAMTGIRGFSVVGLSPSSAPRTSAATSLTSASMSLLGSSSSTRATASAKRDRAAAPPPRVGHDDPMHIGGRPHPHRQPVGADLGRDLSDQPGDGAGREPLPEA